jgi:5-methylcytosine-specific restriction endonuclease McrA
MAITNGTRKNAVQIHCLFCGESFLPWQWAQVTCSYKCGYRYQNLQRQSMNRLIPRAYDCCVRCGIDLTHKRRDAMYCSKTCKSMDHVFKRRGGKTRIPIARRRLIYERDCGRCYMCQESISLADMHVDHLIPVSMGGSSVESNLACSCESCNKRRGIKMTQIQQNKLTEIARDY